MKDISFSSTILKAVKKKPASTIQSWAEIAKKKNKYIKYRKINGTRMVVGAFKR